MAVFSLATTLIPSLTTSNSPTLPHKPIKPTSKFQSFGYTTHFTVLKLSVQSKGRVFAAPEAPTSPYQDEETFGEEEEEEGAKRESFMEAGIEDAQFLSASAEADQMVSKQKIRIKLRSFYVRLIEDSIKQIMDAARTTNAKTMGPIPLPTKRKIYCVRSSPHVHKDAREKFEIRSHQRLIDILQPTAQTIDSLMHLDLPVGVDVEVKL